MENPENMEQIKKLNLQLCYHITSKHNHQIGPKVMFTNPLIFSPIHKLASWVILGPHAVQQMLGYRD